MPNIKLPQFPFSISDTMLAASNTLRKSVARAAARKNLSGYKVKIS